jgi:hypothetical protein
VSTLDWLITRLTELRSTEARPGAEVLVISLDTDPLDCTAQTGDIIIFQEEDGTIGNVLTANETNIEGWED